MTLKRMPRVLLLNYEFPPMGGGAGHASAEIAKTLAAKGCAVDVVTSGVEGQSPEETYEGVKVYRVKSFRRGIHDCGFSGAWSYVFFAQPLCRRLIRKRKYDVIHYFFSLPTGLLALITPGARRIPGVISLRGSDVPGYDPFNKTLQLFHRLLLPLTKYLWRHADSVVALSESLRRQANEAYPGKHIEVISNAVETERFHPARKNVRGDSVVKILTVARLIPRKGMDDLLQALVLLKDERLHLTIQGTGSYANNLERLAIRLGIEDRITFSGFKPRRLLSGVYQDADIFVLPSLAESCGLALLEAMACGLPAVTTRIGGMVEHVEDGENGILVPPRDPTALASAIRRLIRNPAERRAMGRRNAEKIATRYTWDAVTDRYLQIYRSHIREKSNAEAAHVRP